MKTKFFLIMAIVVAGVVSCENNSETAKVSCIDYDYLEYLPKTASLCDSELCKKYRQIWKEIFLEINGITEADLNGYIELMTSSIHEWNDGTSFEISYYFKNDWVIAYRVDQFIIKIKEGNTTYPGLDVPRGPYLTKEEIVRAINFNHAFASDVIKLPFHKKLKFSSKDSAMQFLIKRANVNTLCLNDIYIHYKTGQLLLKANAQYDNEANKCISAKLDLFSGETDIEDGPCFITGSSTAF